MRTTALWVAGAVAVVGAALPAWVQLAPQPAPEVVAVVRPEAVRHLVERWSAADSAYLVFEVRDVPPADGSTAPFSTHGGRMHRIFAVQADLEGVELVVRDAQGRRFVAVDGDGRAMLTGEEGAVELPSSVAAALGRVAEGFAGVRFTEALPPGVAAHPSGNRWFRAQAPEAEGAGLQVFALLGEDGGELRRLAVFQEESGEPVALDGLLADGSVLVTAFDVPFASDWKTPDLEVEVPLPERDQKGSLGWPEIRRAQPLHERDHLAPMIWIGQLEAKGPLPEAWTPEADAFDATDSRRAYASLTAPVCPGTERYRHGWRNRWVLAE